MNTPPILLTELAERVQALTRNNVAVDHMIFAAVRGWSYPLHGAALEEWCAGKANGVKLDYTASLDAAMTLVPEGWFWTLCQQPVAAKVWTEGNRAHWVPRFQDDTVPATPILALIVACLRARAASESNPHGR